MYAIWDEYVKCSNEIDILSHTCMCTFTCTTASSDKLVYYCNDCYCMCTSLLQWVLDYPNPDYPYPHIWMSVHIAMFSVPAGNYVAVTGALLQEKARLLYE